jgi:hypothetical protein
MEKPQLTLDDLYDMDDLVKKLEKSMCRILKNYDRHIALNALLNASARLAFGQCEDITEILECNIMFKNILYFHNIAITNSMLQKDEQ